MEYKKINKKKSKNTAALVSVTIIVAVFTIVLANAEPNEIAASGDVLLEQAGSDVNLGLADEPLEPMFGDSTVQSMNFRKDMSIRDALRFLAAKYKKNIIPSALVQGKLNVTSLYDVTFEQALDAILGPGFYCQTDGDFIRVYTSQEFAQYSQDITRMTSRVYTLYYINAAEAVTLITPILSSQGKVASTSAAATDTEAGDGGDTYAMADTIVVYDFPDRLNKIAEMIKQIDVQPQQILVEVTILEATLSETTDFGINWEKVAGLTNNSFSFTADLSNSGATAFTANIGNDKLTAAISAEEGITDTTVLANPKILALNKQAGYINIGEERGYTASTTQSETTTTSVEFLVSGTILKFRPFICNDNYIRMEINPELSTGSLQDANDNLPLKTITTVMTNIMVKEGQTIIIGGLFKEDLTSIDTQVPVIGDIPIVGSLFKSTSDRNTRKELVVLITPHIVNLPEDLAAESDKKKEDVDRIVYGSRKRVNLISRIRLYEEAYERAVDYYADKQYDRALKELDWIIEYRPNALEAVSLRDRILKETDKFKYDNSERVLVDKVNQQQDGKWIRR